MDPEEINMLAYSQHNRKVLDEWNKCYKKGAYEVPAIISSTLLEVPYYKYG
jgi:hypothetical protein